jgi:signal-transduction protein with cAMP-binding, CBS, and nucleotidyltransferase domain
MDLEIFLKEVPLFSSIPDSQIQKIAACFLTKTYKKDTLIFNQGDESDAMYIIRSGAVLIHSDKGGETPIQIELRRGDFFGEMALLSDMPQIHIWGFSIFYIPCLTIFAPNQLKRCWLSNRTLKKQPVQDWIV